MALLEPAMVGALTSGNKLEMVSEFRGTCDKSFFLNEITKEIDLICLITVLRKSSVRFCDCDYI